MRKVIILAAALIGAIGLGCRSAANQACAVLTGSEHRCNYRHGPIAAVFVVSQGAFSLCTGTLLTQRAVLTAAHCIGGRHTEPAQFKVYTGGEFHAVNRVAVHPGFTGTTPSPHDLAVITLSDDSSADVLPIDMTTAVLPGSEPAVFSYSETIQTAAGNPPDDYRATTMRIDELSQSYFVASFVEPGSIVCSGNSGSPAVLRSIGGKAGVAAMVTFALDRCSRQSRAGLIRVRSDDNLKFILREAPGIELSR